MMRLFRRCYDIDLPDIGLPDIDPPEATLTSQGKKDIGLPMVTLTATQYATDNTVVLSSRPSVCIWVRLVAWVSIYVVVGKL